VERSVDIKVDLIEWVEMIRVSVIELYGDGESF
jgi:hypothetical protein